MQFSSLIIAAAAFASGANAILNLTNTVFAGITVGVPFTITWGDAQGPVTVILQNGDPLNLNNFETIVSNGAFPSGSFTWTPPTTLAADTYNFKIDDGKSPTNYGAQFELVGGATSSVSSGSSVTSTSATGSTSTPSTTSPPSTSSTPSNSTATTTTGSKTSSSSKSSSAPTGSGSSLPNNNSAAGIASPLVLVVLGFAAFLTLN